ncbi:MAG: DUF6807 family protein [Isosphaeraceae bacterium]
MKRHERVSTDAMQNPDVSRPARSVRRPHATRWLRLDTGRSAPNGLPTRRVLLLVVALLIQAGLQRAEADDFAWVEAADRLSLRHGDRPVADYVIRDETILRPYFANLHTPDGRQVTRNHPPRSGQDATDHDTMHPGLWMAFGDINGQDFWRNKGRIEHVRFIEPPRLSGGRLTFAAENRLKTSDGHILGRQISRISLSRLPEGFLLIWQAEFVPGDHDLVFGDQEEMGLGVRVATGITEKNGGIIRSSTGARSAKQTWGRSFDWCDYAGEIDGARVGVTLMPDPANFRTSWFHNRDYGLMVANPFGRKAMNQGEASRFVVKKGERFTLQFGAYLHTTPLAGQAELPSAYRRFLDEKTPARQ